jgi:hypothetical protein
MTTLLKLTSDAIQMENFQSDKWKNSVNLLEIFQKEYFHLEIKKKVHVEIFQNRIFPFENCPKGNILVQMIQIPTHDVITFLSIPYFL